jgi:hypothetical protein
MKRESVNFRKVLLAMMKKQRVFMIEIYIMVYLKMINIWKRN